MKYELYALFIGLYAGYVIAATELSTAINSELISLLVAMLAVILTISTMYFTRVHNRLSVKPALSFRRQKGCDHYDVSLRNNGLGVGTIVKFERFVNGNPVTYEQFKIYIRSIMPDEAEFELIQTDRFDEGFHVPTNANINVAKFKLKEGNVEFINILCQSLSCSVTYSSLYGEKYTNTL